MQWIDVADDGTRWVLPPDIEGGRRATLRVRLAGGDLGG
jgi:hypothetical protein